MIVSPNDDLVKAEARAWANREELLFTPGTYSLGETFRSRCSLYGQGFTKLEWVGPETDQYMVEIVGTSGELYMPEAAGLSFFGANKARGLRIDDVHQATHRRLQFYQTRGGALTVERGWCSNVLDVRALNCTGLVFNFQGLNSGTIRNCGLLRCDSAGSPYLWQVSGMADLSQLTIEDSEAKEAALSLIKFHQGRVSGLWTERLDVPVIVRVQGDFGMRLERFTHWQELIAPGKVAVLFEGCKSPRILGLQASNFSEALVHFHTCTDPQHDGVHERYHLDGFPTYGVQPQWIVRED